MTRSSQSLLKRSDMAALTTAWKTEREGARTPRTIGNTRGADVSAFHPMPVPADLQPLLTMENAK